MIRDWSDKADHVPVDAINTFDPSLRLRYALDILAAGNEASNAFSKAGFGAWDSAISALRRLSGEAAQAAPEWVPQPLNYNKWFPLARPLGFQGPVSFHVSGMGSAGEGDSFSYDEPTPEFRAFVDRARAAGFDWVEKASNFHYFNNWFGFRLPDGEVIAQTKTDDSDEFQELLATAIIPVLSIAGGFGFIGAQIAAATGAPSIVAEAAAKIALTAAAGGDVEQTLLGIVVPQVAQTLIPAPSILDIPAPTFDPTLIEVGPIATVAELVSLPEPLPPVPVFESLPVPVFEAPLVPVFEVMEPVFSLPEPVFEPPPVFELLPELLPVFEPLEPVFELPEQVIEVPLEPLPIQEPELILAPTIQEPIISEVPMWDDPFDLPSGYDVSFDAWTIDIPTFEVPSIESFVPGIEDFYVQPLPEFDALPDIPVSEMAPLTPDTIASVEVTDFAGPADVPVSSVRPPVAEEWTVGEAIKDATAAMVAAAGLVVAFNRLRDAAGGGAVNTTASARTGAGAQVQARDDGMVWTRDPQGRVTSSRPAVGLLQTTTTGNGIINNGNGTYTLIRPDGSRSTLRYPGAVGAAFAGLPAWAPWALAGGAALLLVAARRR